MIAINVSQGPALVIDGKNTAYRSLFAGLGDNRFMESGYHPFIIWLRFARTWIDKFKPSSMNIFWDCPRQEVWRKKVLSEYKCNRSSSDHGYNVDIPAEINKIVTAANSMLPYMNCRMYYRDNQEADDLIYAYCRTTHPNETIIVSSDRDMTQIRWHMPNVKCYEPNKGVFLECDVNPAMQKALMGDKSDNIEGYRGIGPKKSKKLCEDFEALSDFFAKNGLSPFKRNLSLIDMSFNPFRISNEIYVMSQLSSGVNFNREKILEKASKIRGLQAEYHKIIVPFKHMVPQ